MFKRLAGIIGAALLLVSLGGCQLAREDLGEDAVAWERMIGVYVTFAPLSPDRDYYAVPRKRQHEGYETTYYVFEGVPGVALFQALVTDEGQPESYWVPTADEGMMDVHIGIHCKDDGEELELSGKLYRFEAKTIYLNQVYQNSAGEVYMLAGNGFTGPGLTEATISESYDSPEEKYSVKVTVAMEVVEKPVQDVIKEFDGNDQLLKATVITAEDIPDKIVLHSDCAYAIAETHSEGAEGMQIARILLDLDAQYYTFKYPCEQGYLVGAAIEISRDK